jgi:hypothetical protein
MPAARGGGAQGSCRPKYLAVDSPGIVSREAYMMPTAQTCIERIETCISDLSDNGIELKGADDRKLAQVVREHLEYFQLMLGYDSDAREVLALLKRSRPA